MSSRITLQDGSSVERAQEGFAQFERFVSFFCGVFKQPDFLANVDCKPSHKQYVPQYYAKIFTVPTGIEPRHLKWFHRLQPLLSSLPLGATILDYGGGYGMDSIYLAACGYKVVFYEISPHHLAICSHLNKLWEREMGATGIQMVLAQPDNSEKLPLVDAILLNEVAHHIEPPEALFRRCAQILPLDGRLFLLEPNYMNPLTQLFFFKVRGFKTVVTTTDETTGRIYQYGNEHIRSRSRWNRLATQAGLRPERWYPIIPYFLRSKESLAAPWRRELEAMPGVRMLLASHITHEYAKSS